jgi:alcohol dehydrogenase (NADP+)
MTTTNVIETPAVDRPTAIAARGYAARDPQGPLGPFEFERRGVGARDVDIEILYCGVCHSDMHQVRNEWREWFPTVYPVVPGHEIVGRVVSVGREVREFKQGDPVAVGCMVDSCRRCADCREGLEQYCQNEITYTYNSPDRNTGKPTYGGYSDRIVVDEHFVLRVPDGLDLAATAPLLCAGITTYSPLRHWDVGPGDTVGVVGLGGLGHMAIRFARALGARVVLFTTSPAKVGDAKRLGASDVVVSTDAAAMQRHAGRLDFILDTVSAAHSLDAYLQLLKRDGTMCLVGVPENPHPSPAVTTLLGRRRSLTGSGIGGIAETQEMLDFCADNGIVSDVEVIPIQQINEAYRRMSRGDVKYRFVIDMASLKEA